MYFLKLYFQNAKLNRIGKFEVFPRNGYIPKWTLLSPEKKTLEIFRLISLSAAAVPSLIGKFKHSLKGLQYCDTIPLHLEFSIYHHPQTEGKSPHQYRAITSGLDILQDASVRLLIRKECNFLSTSDIYRKISLTKNPTKRFFLAYGHRFSAHDGTDNFDFTNPQFMTTRFHTLFHTDRNLTDPVAFLKRMRYKGLKHKKYLALTILTTVSRLAEVHLDIDPALFTDPFSDPAREWRSLTRNKRRMLLPLLDICRHLYDAFPKANNPLDMPGAIIFHRPDKICKEGWFSAWILMVDSLLPNMQFFISLPESKEKDFPEIPKNLRLRLNPTQPSRQEKKKPPRLPKKPVLLVHVDGRLPNLALMKLSRYYKEQGKNVILTRKPLLVRGVDAIFASCIYQTHSATDQIRRLEKYYGGNLSIGGSGIDLKLRLPEIVEKMPADYELYPELKDRAIGFLTRGCPHKCPFCLVPQKEGAPRQVASLSSLLENKRKKLILLDDNLLAYENSEDLLEEMASLGLKVNFTQTLDLRYINRKKVALLRRIECMNTRFTRSNYHFSLNDNMRLSTISKKYSMFGFTSRDNVEFICMYGFDTTLAQDVERFRFLRSLPGAYVFVQQYQPVGTATAPPRDIAFFDDNADRLIDELVSIVFPQNMKSMEKYYRWVSRRYAMEFGKLHSNLVDTIFRYNHRYKRGEYISTLAGTRK